jgi:phosphate transport system permease protein
VTDVSIDPRSGPTLDELAGDPRRKRRELATRAVFLFAASLSLFITALIVLSLVGEAWSFVSRVPRDALFGSDQWAPRFDRFDIMTPLAGSLVVTGVAMLIAVPAGLGAAVFLSEYANPRVRRLLKPTLEILAGIPSVVLGFFALRWIAPNIMQRFFDADIFSLGAAGIGVGILVIPLMASISEDALRSVPDSLREASAGIGARKVTTTVRVVIPAAVSGLVAAFIVAVSRAIGETMVVFLAGGGGGNQAPFNLDPREFGTTMTAAMAAQASGSDSVAGSDLVFPSLYFLGFLLFVITFGLNMVAERFVRRVRQVY